MGRVNFFCVEEERYDTVTFKTFLAKVLAHYPSGEILMILDNARIPAKILQPFLEENHHRFEFFLPPYSSQLHLMEGLLMCLKESVVNNVFSPSIQKSLCKSENLSVTTTNG